MNNRTLFNQMEKIKKSNSKIAKALDIFERTQKIYERCLESTSYGYDKQERNSSYSSSISKKDYHANISTTTK